MNEATRWQGAGWYAPRQENGEVRYFWCGDDRTQEPDTYSIGLGAPEWCDEMPEMPKDREYAWGLVAPCASKVLRERQAHFSAEEARLYAASYAEEDPRLSRLLSDAAYEAGSVAARIKDATDAEDEYLSGLAAKYEAE